MLMPAIFFGHGNPMYALSANAYTEAWHTLGKSLPTPKAILAISAHWFIPHTAVTANAMPPTIHDFGGFPKALYEVEYPAQGSMALVERVESLLRPTHVSLNEDWGLDHGTWSILKHVYPHANIPVVQLSIDKTQPPAFHFALGKQLSTLREEGVLVIGSGNIVHNLATYAWGRDDISPYDWAARFEQQICAAILNGNDEVLINYLSLGQDAVLSAPTPEHYLPLLYMMGMRRPQDSISFPVDGMDGGSISMLAVQVG